MPLDAIPSELLIEHECGELYASPGHTDPLGKRTAETTPSPPGETAADRPQRHWIPAKRREARVERPPNPYGAPRRGSVRAKRKRTKRGRLS